MMHLIHRDRKAVDEVRRADAQTIPGTVPCVVSAGHDTAGLSPVSCASGIYRCKLTQSLPRWGRYLQAN